LRNSMKTNFSTGWNTTVNTLVTWCQRDQSFNSACE
jgi:hypothetical protein